MGEHRGWFDWAYKGVDHSFPGNGGLECRDFLSFSQRCWESIIASLVAFCVLLYAVPRLRLPCDPPCGYSGIREPLGKRLLLLLMCLTFGIELGFKLATRQMIWIGNPCHVTTMLQIFILAAPPSRIVTAAFRLHLHMLTGAPIAILFPVINTRLLPFETTVYFVQHILMLIIPFYLMKKGDPFIPEKMLDFNWALASFGLLFLYHFLPLQMLAYVSQVNLNNMLCPAVSDPFHGKYYRLFAIAHQLILIPTLGKAFLLIAKAFKVLPDECHFNEVPVFCSSPPRPISCSPCSLNTFSNDSHYNNSDYDSGFINGRPDCQAVENSCSSTHSHYDGPPSYPATDGPSDDHCVDGEASGIKQPGFVIRRIVNGKVLLPENNADESCNEPSIRGSSASGSQRHPLSGSRTGSNRTMTYSELSSSNGHAKSH